MISGQAFLRNALLNFAGQAAPLLAAVVAIPSLLTLLGAERFGILALAWGVLGYFGLFDLGLGRALTQRVAAFVGRGELSGLPTLISTALTIMAAVGVVGLIVVYIMTPWLAYSALRITPDLVSETIASFHLIAFAIPLLVITAGLRGVLEGLGMFGPLNVIRVPLGILTFVAPLGIAHHTTDLSWMVGILLILRAASLAAHFAYCWRAIPGLRIFKQIDSCQVGPLFRFGGWMTISNILGPLMVYSDRFLIGALLSLAAVTYYVVPYEIITKLWIIPGAVVSVLFPGFAGALASRSESMARLYGWGIKAIFLGIVPITLLFAYLAPEFLPLWIGQSVSAEAARVAQWLALGVLVNSFAQVSFALLQGAGRPDITAKLHLLELPVYFALMYGLTKLFGIEGAAIAWTARALLDALLLALTARRVAVLHGSLLRFSVALVYLALFAFWALIATSMAMRIVSLAIAATFFVPVAWYAVLNPQDRAHTIAWLRTTLLN